MYKLTERGETEVKFYLKELAAKRREIIDTGIDTVEYTNLPTADDILMDIAHFIEPNGDYCNGWGVTDNYDADYPLYLKNGFHFIEVNHE